MGFWKTGGNRGLTSRLKRLRCGLRRSAWSEKRKREAGSWQLEAGSWKPSMRINLKVWRQPTPTQAGQLVPYTAEDVSPDMSFLEMLDVVNEALIAKGEDPIAFDSDCREGICGTCGFMVNGVAARPGSGDDGLPAAHAAVQGRRHDHARAVARQGLPGRSRTSSSIAARSTGSSRPAATRRSTSAARRTATPS